MATNFYIWSGAFAFIAVSGIGFFILTRDSRKEINQWFCLFAIAVASWAVGSFLGNIIPGKSSALWVMRGNYFFGAWVPSLYVAFVYALSAKPTPEKQIKRNCFIAASVLFSGFVLTPFFIPDLRLVEGYPFLISQPGPAYYFFFGFFTLAMTEVIYQTFRELSRRSGLEFRQFQYVSVANVLAILAGFEYFLCVFGVLSRPPFDDYLLVAYALVLAYGVTRHRLFDVDALVRAFRKERLSTLGLLASSVNHEIKNPLFVIRGLLDGYLDKNNVRNSSSVDAEAAMRKIYAQVDRIAQVIARINRLAKEGETKKKGFSEISSVSEALQSSIDVIGLVKNGKDVRFVTQIPVTLPFVQIAPGEMEEVFINLLANAYDAIGQAGEILIQAEQQGNKVRVRVSDNGSGVLPDQRRHMFKPFFTTKKEGGVGLGLYLSKEIIDRSGGSVRMRNAQPSGTCFEIDLLAAAEIK